MKEKILQFVWKNNLFDTTALISNHNEKIQIIDVGKENTNAGPDFFNAKIKIGETIWAGNVEIHIASSDWNKHHHTQDAAYNNVILNVSTIIDTPIFNRNGEEIMQVQVTIPPHIEARYKEISQTPIHCSSKLFDLPDIIKTSWLNALVVERLEIKCGQIQHYLNENKNNWEETFYIMLAKNFGFSVNSQPFELLAKSLPMSYLCKHKNDLFQIEALFFGQAGYLNDDLKDDYYQKLKKEYAYLRCKFGLTPIEKHYWKMLRIHPNNFPQIRIAQLAQLVYQSSQLFSKIIQNPYLKNIYEYLKIEPSAYWERHYSFGKKSEKLKKSLGKNAINIICINTIVPILFLYGKLHDNERLKSLTIDLLECIPPENNHIIQYWKRAGFMPQNAYDTQALIQLYKVYCDEKRCFSCRFGHKLLSVGEDKKGETGVR